MLIFFRAFALACISLHMLAATAFAQEVKPVRGPNGNPETTLVEEPQDALKAWSREKRQNSTLLLISPGPGITPLGGEEASLAAEMIKNGKWEDLLAKSYPTPRPYLINPSNYIYAAHRAGMIGKIYWVPPTKKSVGAEPLDSFKEFLKGLGVGADELSGLRQADNSIDGNLNGIPVHICNLADLPEIQGDVIAAIDISFFSTLYENEVKTPYLDLFGGFISSLGEKGIPISGVVISYSTTMGQVPLDQRFVGGYLYTYFTDPGKLKDGPMPAWELRSQAMYYETFFQPDETVQYFQDAVKLDPADASLRYGLSKSYFASKNLDRLKEEIDKAVAIDKGYYPAYMDYARYFASKDMQAVAEVLLQGAVKANPEDPRPYDALYELYFANGKYDEAAKSMEKLIALGFDWSGNLARLAEAYKGQGLHEKAEKTYEDALGKIPKVEKDARAGLLLSLAAVYEQDKKIEKALDLYGEALSSISDPHERMQVQAKVDELKKTWAPFLKPNP